jgi:CDP-diacylglycerol--glycerol-3-phosphate 3-phosphatidyltransferase
LKNLANKLTVLRIILVPVFLLLEYTGHSVAAFVVYVLASLTDLVDGYIARHYNQVTVFGKFMDPLADKMLVLSAMCFLIETGIMPAWAVAAVIFREFAVSGLRLMAAQKNIVIAAAQSGKIKTACTMVCVCLMLFFLSRPIPLLNGICIALIVVTTLYSGFEYFKNNIQVFKES